MMMMRETVKDIPTHTPHCGRNDGYKRRGKIRYIPTYM